MFFMMMRSRLSNFEEIIASNGGHDFVLSAFRLAGVIVFVTNLNGCIWHACAYFNQDMNALTWLDISDFIVLFQ